MKSYNRVMRILDYSKSSYMHLVDTYISAYLKTSNIGQPYTIFY